MTPKATRATLGPALLPRLVLGPAKENSEALLSLGPDVHEKSEVKIPAVVFIRHGGEIALDTAGIRTSDRLSAVSLEARVAQKRGLVTHDVLHVSN